MIPDPPRYKPVDRGLPNTRNTWCVFDTFTQEPVDGYAETTRAAAIRMSAHLNKNYRWD